MAEENSITEYNLVKVMMDGVKNFMCDGIKITDEIESEQEYHGASNDPFQTTLKKRKVSFELINPRDHASLQLVTQRCRDGETFTIVTLAKDRHKNWKAMERCIGCMIPTRERTLGNLESPKLVIRGSAQDSILINTQFE